jgi:hypothetical protein
MPVFGLAGLAEAGLAITHGTLFLGLLLLALLAALGVIFRSRVLCTTGLVLLGLITCLLAPWLALETPEPSSDPDEEFWRADYLRLVHLWIIVALGIIGSAIWAFMKRRKAEPASQETHHRSAISGERTVNVVSWTQAFWGTIIFVVTALLVTMAR